MQGVGIALTGRTASFRIFDFQETKAFGPARAPAMDLSADATNERFHASCMPRLGAFVKDRMEAAAMRAVMAAAVTGCPVSDQSQAQTYMNLPLWK
jgi:hypothetical protein